MSGQLMRSGVGRRAIRPDAAFVIALSIAGLMLAGCQGGLASPAESPPNGASATQYGTGEKAFEACLQDKGVAFRLGSDGSLAIVNSEDPAVSEATNFCNDATTRPASEQSTAYNNAITLAIADCLEKRGYHVTRNGDSGLDDGGGRTVATFRVADAEQESAGYRADVASCQKDAEKSVPSPSA